MIGNSVGSQGGVDVLMHGLVGLARIPLSRAVHEICIAGGFNIQTAWLGGFNPALAVNAGFTEQVPLAGGFDTTRDIPGGVPEC